MPCCCNNSNVTTYEGSQKFPKKSYIMKKLNRKIGFASLKCGAKLKSNYKMGVTAVSKMIESWIIVR